MRKSGPFFLHFCLPFFLYAILLFTPAKAEAQFKRLSLREGLSQSQVFCVVQDMGGFLWFGTLDGLNKYDGTKFTIFRRMINDPHSLSDNNILSLCVDKSGTLWIGTEGGGLNRLNPDMETFAHFEHDPAVSTSLGNNFVNVILQSGKGFLLIGTDGGGLYTFDQKSEEFRLVDFSPYDAQIHVNAVVEESQGTLWMGTTAGLFKKDAKNGKVDKFVHDPAIAGSLSHDEVGALMLDKEGNLWVGTSDGLDRLNRGSGEFEHFKHQSDKPNSLSDNNIKSLFQDSKGSIWVGTERGGLNRWDSKNRIFTRYVNDPVDPESISDNSINDIFEDRSGVLWIATNNNGLSKLSLVRKNFHVFRKRPYDDNSLSNNVVWAVHQDKKGIFWVGTENGLNRIDRKRGKITRFYAQEDSLRSISHNLIRAICEDSQGNLWVGTDGGGVDKRDSKTGKWENFSHDSSIPMGLSSNYIRVIFEDHSGLIWIGTLGGGLNCLDPQKNKCVVYRNEPGNSASLNNDNVYSLMEDSRGDLWVGTLGGLNVFNRAKKTFHNYTYNPDDPASISDNGIGVIYEDTKGNFWVGTDSGLNKFDRTRNIFIRYTVKDGLPNDFIYGMLEDDSGHLWISTNRGLSRFHIGTEFFRNYDIADGIQSNEFNAGSFFKNDSGEMFFGGINGLTFFYPDEIKDNLYIPPVVLTEFKKFDRAVRFDRPLNHISSIRLHHKDDFISFRFAALDFNAPENNQYLYKMEGFEASWHACEAEPRATYTNLNPGDYIFRVIGSNNDGVWNRKGLSIHVEILPPFWSTAWFRILAVLLLGAMVFLVIQFRTRQVYAQRKKLQELVRLKTEQLQKANKELEKLAGEDALTKIANRRTFQKYMDLEWKKAQREKDPLSLIMIDVDLFKLFNDTYGHQAGDDCLVQLACVLKETVKRPGDFIARYGGEEFAVILLNTNKEGAVHVAQEIKENMIKRHIPFRNSPVKNVVTVSLGVSTLVPSSENNPTQLILYADRALYEAKKCGRNWIISYTPV
ncbi:MAG: diguanylate cyclase [Candidatus Aminicenantes bacterium]|nr:diguanylate cyclase [Candidatus Aminicenantes bacterium]